MQEGEVDTSRSNILESAKEENRVLNQGNKLARQRAQGQMQ